MEDMLKNKLFNYAIDILFANVDVTNEQLSQILQKEELIKFFYVLLNEFEFNPDDVRIIFENTNPNNNNLNMIFKENAQNLLSKVNFDSLSFMDIFINYIKFAMNNEDLSHIHICYNTIKKMILNISYTSNNINNSKINIIQKSINELCFVSANLFPYNPEDKNEKYEKKRQLILKESFFLFKEYIKTKNKIHLWHLTKNYIIELINHYSSNSHIQLLLLYHIFHHRNFQFEIINLHRQLQFNYDVYKETFYSYFNFLDLYYDYFVIQRNKNIELENIFVVLISQITKYFPNYNLFNTEIITQFNNYEKEKINLLSFCDKYFFIKNIKIFNNIFFYKNPYKASILFINIIMKNKILTNLDSVNYYDLDKLFKNFILFMDNEIKEEFCENNNIKETKKYCTCLFLKISMIIFIFFSSDLIIFAPIIETEDVKLKKNSFKFFLKLINILFLLLKKYHIYITPQLKDKILSLMNEISMSNPPIYFFMLQNESIFNEELIHFLIDNIPHAIMSIKHLSFLLKYDRQIEPELFLNGLIMFGYWVNKYPFKERYINGLNILTCIQKAIDMRGLLKTEKNVDKFILGIYLFFKAFPKSKNDTKGFLNFLSKEIDYSFEKKTKDKIDNLCQFIKKELFMNDCYSNKNTLYVDINDFLKNNLNK
jgi:hypothetical protein